MQNINRQKSEHTVILETIMVSLVLVFMSVFYYGLRALAVVIISVISCMLADIICKKINKKQIKLSDLSSIHSGIILALMMPASVPYKVIIFAGVFSMIVGKHIFGGKNNNIFVPCAVGYLFSAFSFKDYVLMYPKPGDSLSVFSDVTTNLFQSLTKTLDIASSPSCSNVDIYLGNIIGPMGTSHFFVLLIIALVLILRKDISCSVFLSSLATIVTFSLISPVMGDSLYTSVLYELSTGMVLFGLIFISCDYYTTPKKVSLRIIYGFIIGILTVVIKRFGSVENSIIFATLLANPIKVALDETDFSFKSSFRHIVKKIKAVNNKAKEISDGKSETKKDTVV